MSGASANPGALYRVPIGAISSHCLAAAGVGNAQAALELTTEAIKERSTSYTAARMRDFQAVQLRVARAGAQIDAARLICRADCLEAQGVAEDGRLMTMEDKLRCRRNVAYAMELCTEAVDSLHALAGANGIYDRYPIQRLFRDQHALAAHIGFSWDAQGSPVSGFRPDFYLPGRGVFIELTTADQRLVTRKNRKVRRMRKLYPEVPISVVYQRDFSSLLASHGLLPVTAGAA